MLGGVAMLESCKTSPSRSAALARKTGRRADAGQFHLLDKAAVQGEELHLPRGVLKIEADEAIADEAHLGQRFSACGMISCQSFRFGGRSMAITRRRGALTSVLKNSRGPSLPKK